jgi:ankyrin repeat protein
MNDGLDIFGSSIRGDLNGLKRGIKYVKNGINKQDTGGYTCLMYASRHNQLEIVKFLIKSGANVNINNKLYTALSIAAYKGHNDIVEELLKGHVIIDDSDGIRWSALLWASFNNKADIVRTLLENGSDVFNGANGTNASSFSVSLRHKETTCVIKKHLVKKFYFLKRILSADIVRHIVDIYL